MQLRSDRSGLAPLLRSEGADMMLMRFEVIKARIRLES
jgi:hypothetical protein